MHILIFNFLKFNAHLEQFSDNHSFKIDHATYKKILVKTKLEFEDLGKRDSVSNYFVGIFKYIMWSQLKPEERK